MTNPCSSRILICIARLNPPRLLGTFCIPTVPLDHHEGPINHVAISMSSKFFTWTKGDRRNAQEALQTGGVVPIPVECLKIKGMEYGRSAKVGAIVTETERQTADHLRRG